jgi:hypothetical protein
LLLKFYPSSSPPFLSVFAIGVGGGEVNRVRKGGSRRSDWALKGCSIFTIFVSFLNLIPRSLTQDYMLDRTLLKIEEDEENCRCLV